MNQYVHRSPFLFFLGGFSIFVRFFVFLLLFVFFLVFFVLFLPSLKFLCTISVQTRETLYTI